MVKFRKFGSGRTAKVARSRWKMLGHVLLGPINGPAFSSLVFAINTLHLTGRRGRPQSNLFSLIVQDLGSKMKWMFASVQPKDRSDAEYKAAFKMFDRDGDGTITRGEIQKVLATLGQEATQEELDALMGDIDVDGDGTISLNEFKTMMERLMETNEQDDRQLLEDSFHEFDVYGNGLIGVEDLLYVFRKLGDDEITREEVEMMIIDATGTTKRKEVTLEEFKAVSKGF